MCFHASQTKKVVELENRFKVNLHDDDARDAFDIPYYHLNGFSHPETLIIPQEGKDLLVVAKWGIVPSNTKAETVDNYYKDSVRFGGGLNSQSEKLFNHFIYKNSVMTRRCIVPVTGFFEPHEHNTKKYPYYIHREDSEAFGLAGIYTLIDDLVTFTILTKDASPYFAEIHNKRKRQPVLLHEELEQEWLSEDLTEKNIMDLIKVPYQENELESYTVSKDLFHPKINSDFKEITNKVDYPELASLF